MNTLSEQLTQLYECKWNGLMKQLEANGLRDKLQCPFLISLLQSGQKKEEREKAQALIGYDKWYAQKETPEHEEWYTKADIKIMFFGKEPNSWEKGADVGDTMAVYEDFLDDHYDVSVNGGSFNQGSNFFKVGINHIMAGVEKILLNYPGKQVSMIWNEISKLSVQNSKGGGLVNAFTHSIEREYFHVIPKEIEILQPDILIFFTGPGENNYYRYIIEEDNFTLIGEPEQLADLNKYDIVKFHFKEVKLAYKTWHPQTMKKGLREQVYQAILADIKENIDKLLKEE